MRGADGAFPTTGPRCVRPLSVITARRLNWTRVPGGRAVCGPRWSLNCTPSRRTPSSSSRCRRWEDEGLGG
eukprot:2508403-Rhodomonas_salina.1